MGGNRDHPGVDASDPVAGWKIDFVHRTIQEYLTAKEIAEEDHIGAPLDVAHLDQWQQVVIMTAGHANTPLRVQLVAGLVDRANRERRHGRTLTLLAAACIESSPSLPPELRDRVEDQLGALLPPSGIVQTRALASRSRRKSLESPVHRKVPAGFEGRLRGKGPQHRDLAAQPCRVPELGRGL